MTPAIEAINLNKHFGAIHAVRMLSLTLAPGEALGLLGPNGAGKSTTLSMLMGLRAADTGSVRIFGHPAGSAEARGLMGATPQSAGFPDQVTPRELLAYAGRRYPARQSTDTLIAAFGLSTLIDRRMAGFSGGEVRRVALALAFVGRPKLVFLDEPTTGLDTTAQEAFRDVTRTYVAEGGALVLTSHHWDEIEAICGRITLIDRGERVLDGTLAQIRAQMHVNRISFALPDGVEAPAFLNATTDKGRWHVQTTDSDALLRRMVAEGVAFADLGVQPLDLKDIVETLRKEA